ncbi:MAG: membrane protein insertion efficiency factor YidD [Enterovibrio sp.]
MIAKLSIKMIERYQIAGGSRRFFNIECNFEPTCSQYAKLCIAKYGACKGWRLAFSRIKRCNNPHQVGKIIDPVP